MVQIKTGTKKECSWELPEDLYYHEQDHIWAKVEGDKVLVGLDMFGQYAAGKIQLIRVMPIGRKVQKNHSFGTIESGKFIGPMRAPISGEIIDTNKAVLDKPSIINDGPYENWIAILKPSNLEEELKDLPHGEEGISKWMNKELDEYAEKELLKCD